MQAGDGGWEEGVESCLGEPGSHGAASRARAGSERAARVVLGWCLGGAWDMRSYSLGILFVFPSCSLRVYPLCSLGDFGGTAVSPPSHGIGLTVLPRPPSKRNRDLPMTVQSGPEPALRPGIIGQLWRRLPAQSSSPWLNTVTRARGLAASPGSQVNCSGVMPAGSVGQSPRGVTLPSGSPLEP